jgi:putative serine protease PepD
MPCPGGDARASEGTDRLDSVELDDGQEEEGPLFAWLPPEDRLWRHPSEVGGAGPPRAPSHRSSTGSRIWAVALVAGVVGALLASGVGMWSGSWERRTVVEPVATPTPDTVALAVSTPAGDGVGDWPTIANALAPSIVAVQVDGSGGQEAASGVLYAASRDRSYVITAADVVGGGDRITVAFDSGDTAGAHLVGTDPTTGIALLWVPGAHRTFPMFGSVAGVQVADSVLAIGARTADATTIAPGAISGLDQRLAGEGGLTLYGMLAVSDITIPEAADGGALVDGAGAVVGIDTDLTSVDPNEQGVAYAVPVDMAEHVAQALLEGRTPSHPWLGIENAADISTATARELGIAGGAQVGTVANGSPAATDGLAPNDVVTAFDGEPVTSSGALVMLLSQCQPRQRTTITFLDHGRERTEPITVTEQPAYPGS